MKNKNFFFEKIIVNQNGNLSIAKRFLDNTSECRFDTVKFQKKTINLDIF